MIPDRRQPQSAVVNQLRLLRPLPAPEAWPDGEGVYTPGQQPHYARSYIQDPFLLDQVLKYRQARWAELYRDLERKLSQRPEHLDTYRLQADAYLVNLNYEEGASQLDQVLCRLPRDVHALAVTATVFRLLGRNEEAANRLRSLEAVASDAAVEVAGLWSLVESSPVLTSTFDGATMTTPPEAIAVFGQAPNAQGKPGSGLEARLEAVLKLSRESPYAWIVVSGGAVRSSLREADVMEEWLLGHGMNPGRVVKDVQARDTVGNAFGMLTIFQQYGLQQVTAVTSHAHAVRASRTLAAAARRFGWRGTIRTHPCGAPADERTLAIEMGYTYVTAARAYGLFERDDFFQFGQTR